MNQFARTQILLGEEAIYKLSQSRVAIFGIGGVGGYVCEALVRSGVGAFDLIDNDRVSVTNLNRQIIATQKTVGRYKTEVMKERMLDINPNVDVRIHNSFFLPENASEFPFEEYDYVVDAVDTVTAKIELILRAQSLGIPVISAMGAGNKLDPGRFRVADIYETSVCPLARVMRRELKKRNVKKLKVVYSDEPPIQVSWNEDCEEQEYKAEWTGDEQTAPKQPCSERVGAEQMNAEQSGSRRKAVPGSTAFVPAVAGLMIAGEIVKDLAANAGKKAEQT